MNSRRLAILSVLAVLCSSALPAAQPPAAVGRAYTGPRTPDGKPNLNGIWQAMSTAHWDLEPHSAADGIPAGLGVVEGDSIPYQPAAAAKKNENYANRATLDPLHNCYLPGVPRITYVPFPFQIAQTSKHVVLTYEYAHATRIVYTDGSPHVAPNDFWMGDSRGRWEKDTLVVDVTHFNDRTWFDMAGNFHSDALHVIERYTPARGRPRDALRGDDRGSEGFYEGLEDQHADLSPGGEKPADSRLRLRGFLLAPHAVRSITSPGEEVSSEENVEKVPLVSRRRDHPRGISPSGPGHWTKPERQRRARNLPSHPNGVGRS